jgi:hypothetical protein
MKLKVELWKDHEKLIENYKEMTKTFLWISITSIGITIIGITGGVYLNVITIILSTMILLSYKKYRKEKEAIKKESDKIYEEMYDERPKTAK